MDPPALSPASLFKVAAPSHLWWAPASLCLPWEGLGKAKGTGGAVTALLRRLCRLAMKGTDLHTAGTRAFLFKTSIWRAGQILPDKEYLHGKRLSRMN